MCRIVYSPRYNMGLLGLERLHPFDSHKYGRAWRRLRTWFGPRLRASWIRPNRAVSRDELLAVHTVDYLEQLRRPAYVAGALELPIVARLPRPLLEWAVLRPMRWATRGTLLAAAAALEHGLAINLGGGFHHAKPARGEGFCIYADIALAVAHLRRQGQLSASAPIAYVDLDAHQGNGVCHCFLDDDRVAIFDMYHQTNYPAYDATARRRIDCAVPLTSGCQDAVYLGKLRGLLPAFLDKFAEFGPPALAIFVAGTDVYEADPLGDLGLSATAICERDLFTVGELRRRRIPTLMLLGGGYTPVSYELVAASVRSILAPQLGGADSTR